MHPTISSSVIPFSSCLQSFPASGSFQKLSLSSSQTLVGIRILENYSVGAHELFSSLLCSLTSCRRRPAIEARAKPLKQQSESPKLTDYIRASGCKERRQEGPVLRISFHLGQPGVAHMHRHSVLLLWLLLGGEPPLMPLPQLQPRPQQGTSCQEHQLTHSQSL